MLLDIVARSLYSDKEVFVRELISNASDALEKFRYTLLADSEAIQKFKNADRKLEIHISTNKQNRTLTIQDTGIGMTKDEMISNLGVIARSGSKAFLEQLKSKKESDNIGNIIGQFGVGFYSAFMVAEKVEVYSKAATDEQGYRWSSDGYKFLNLILSLVGVNINYILVQARMKFSLQKVYNMVRKL